MIPFNKPCFVGTEINYIQKSIENNHISGDGTFSKKCQFWFKEKIRRDVFLTPSCTDALEMAAILTDIKPEDEVIMPSFTFVSTATAFVLRGAKIKFVDIRPDTMNIDETKIEEAITPRTKAIVPVHYAGVGCEMDTINEIAKKYNLYVIEDAAQGIYAKYKDKFLGTIGDLGAFSFHETKNLTSGGEGGAIIINNENFLERAEIIREKGTNRCKFFRGEVDKYMWVDIGSSFLMNDISAAYLFAQLENIEKIISKRKKLWNLYYTLLEDLKNKELIDLPKIPEYIEHNAHIFYIKVKNKEERSKLINFLKSKGIHAVFHYIPLHISPAGKKYGEFVGVDEFTTRESNRLLRLPLFYDLKEEEVNYICEEIENFYTS